MRNQANLSKMQKSMHALAVESAAEMIAEIIFEVGSRQLRGSDK
jgi:hypothetical protein